MRLRSKFKILVVGTVCLNSFWLDQRCNAAETLTLSISDLLKRAEKNASFVSEDDALRRSAKAKLEFIEMSRWLSTFNMTALGGLVPDAKVNKSNVNDYRPNTGSIFSHLGGFFQVNSEAIQPIFTFGKIAGYEEIGKHNIHLTQLEIEKKNAEVRALVKKAYYALLFSSESLNVLDEVDRRLNEAAEKVEEALVKNADNVSEIDRLKIGVFKADVKNRRLDAERANKLSQSALSELAALSGDWKIDQVNLTPEKIFDSNKENIISLALRAKPELNQLNDAIAMKEAERGVVRSDYFPTLFIGGKLEYAVAPGRTSVDNPYLNDPFNLFNVGVAIGIKQDLGWFRTAKKMDEVQAELDRLKAQRQQLLMKIRLETDKSFEDAASALEAIKVNEDGFRAARSWLTSAGLSFNLGTAETKDLLESFAAFFKARVDLIKSIFTLNVALADLSQTSGTEVVSRLK